MNDEANKNEEQQAPKLSIKHLLISTLGAAIGVQSKDVYEKDFQQKSIMPYIVAGIVFTALFLFTLIAIVSFVVD